MDTTWTALKIINKNHGQRENHVCPKSFVQHLNNYLKHQPARLLALPGHSPYMSMINSINLFYKIIIFLLTNFKTSASISISSAQTIKDSGATVSVVGLGKPPTIVLRRPLTAASNAPEPGGGQQPRHVGQ